MLNPLSANPTKWSNTQTIWIRIDELFECVWLFCAIYKRVKKCHASNFIAHFCVTSNDFKKDLQPLSRHLPFFPIKIFMATNFEIIDKLLTNVVFHLNIYDEKTAFKNFEFDF